MRAVCARCTQTRQFGDRDFIESVREQLDALAARIGSETPAKACDDPDAWDWRGYLSERVALSVASPQKVAAEDKH